ncbi:G-type lectin S-receptor-like serine/threonine-protein kinase SD3-1 [Acorus gramineus]|uniref:Receptor-like serine/threonine-protein kinase n=1 Tax=Acorus gramineus TaxID=55184 RepID=A0AAV9A6W9_ACOGR|nr:G-type lectin S-receptor-like serine/threonine-protein kinase SD3-1 [Acorus gramineus]
MHGMQKHHQMHFRGKCTLAALFVLSSIASGENFQGDSVPLGFELSGHGEQVLVSQNGVFAFGFLSDSSKNDYFVVGIRYNLGNSDVNLPVWTVGGGIRVSENSTFRLSIDGSFVLIDGFSGSPVWNSNTSNLGVVKACLLDNGNLVLVGLKEGVIWGSFNSPTDTLLPGQSLQFPQTLRARSLNSVTSPYSFGVRRSGNVELIWEDTVTYWSSQFGPSVVVKEANFDEEGVFRVLDAYNASVWYQSAEDFSDPSVYLRHMRIDFDGNLRIYSWNGDLGTWKVTWQAVGNQCDVFGSCGIYGLCSYNSTGPVCECLSSDGLDYGMVSETGSRTYRCKAMVDLGSCEFGSSLLVLKHTEIYSLYPPHDVRLMLSLDACKDFCLNDSSCFASTSRNDGSGLCTIKKTSYISGYRYSYVPATSFLKVCSVPQAADVHINTSVPLYAQQSATLFHESKVLTTALAIVLLISISAFLTIETFMFWYIYRKRKNHQMSIPLKNSQGLNYSGVIRLSFEEVKGLTRNFVNELGPNMFKGALPNRMPVTVKLLTNVIASERQFHMVVSAVGSAHHRNLVSIKGFCFEHDHKSLIYEYVRNGSLDQWLFNNNPNNRYRDSWKRRLDIAIGIARVITYLHMGCNQCIVHGDLRLENVLLDECLVAKVTGFGLGRLFEKEIVSSSETLPERDVYMFGEILLRIVCGKKDVNGENLMALAYEACQDGNLDAFIDARLEGIADWEEVERTVKIALWCMQNQTSRRPSMGEVVKILEGVISVDMPPSSTAFALKDSITIKGEQHEYK